MSHRTRSVLPAFAALLLAAGLCAPGQAAPAAGPESFTLRLGAAELEPAEGQRNLPRDPDAPFLVQLYDVPGQDEVERWRARGVRLLRYVGGNAYTVHAPGGAAAFLSELPGVRAALALAPEMRRSRLFDSDPVLAARLRGGEVLALHLRFYPHVSFAEAREVLASLGIASGQERFGDGRSLVVHAQRRELDLLLERDEVAWVDPALPAAGPASNSAAERAGIHRVRGWAGFRHADGGGVRLGIWDWFPTFTHADLEDRVVHAAVRPGESLHGHWISGIAAGAGILDSRARGMATAASLYWYSWRSDLWSRIATARVEDGVRITNHSWAIHPGWHYDWAADPSHFLWTGDTWGWGYYHVWTAAADELARSSDVLLVMAVGNDRELSNVGAHTHGFLPDESSTGLMPQDGRYHRDLHPPNPAYTSIAGPANGKNVLAVGATNKDDEMSAFAGWGPTADGRVKPDVVAAGTDIMMPSENDGYEFGSGTSASTAVVTGTAALLSDYALRRYGAEPSALLLKGLLIHAARDLGRPGPDYVYGHGMIDARLAARVLRSSVRPEPRLRSLLIERQMLHGGKRRVAIEVEPEARELRATLVWHDAPGDRLVNDLDLWLVSPAGEVVRPYVLDPERPDAVAVRGPNRVDNVEVARVEAPEPGRWYVFVRAASVPMGPQRYALLVSAGDGDFRPLKLDEGSCGITQFYATEEGPEGSRLSRPKDSFRPGDRLWLTTRFYVPRNSDYGDFYGSIEVSWTITGPTGEVIVKQATSGTRRYVLEPEWGSYFTNRYEVLEALTPGDYVARTVVRMHNGEEATAEYRFRVER